MDEEIQKQIAALDGKLDDIYRSVEKTRKYFLWTLAATVIAFILPLIGLMVAIPQFLSLYGSAMNF